MSSSSSNNHKSGQENLKRNQIPSHAFFENELDLSLLNQTGHNAGRTNMHTTSQTFVKINSPFKMATSQNPFSVLEDNDNDDADEIEDGNGKQITETNKEVHLNKSTAGNEHCNESKKASMNPDIRRKNFVRSMPWNQIRSHNPFSPLADDEDTFNMENDDGNQVKEANTGLNRNKITARKENCDIDKSCAGNKDDTITNDTTSPKRDGLAPRKRRSARLSNKYEHIGEAVSHATDLLEGTSTFVDDRKKEAAINLNNLSSPEASVKDSPLRSTKRKRTKNNSGRSPNSRTNKCSKVTNDGISTNVRSSPTPANTTNTQSTPSSTHSASDESILKNRSFRCGITCLQGTDAFETTELTEIVRHMKLVHNIMENQDLIQHLHSVPTSPKPHTNQLIRACGHEHCQNPVITKRGFVQHFKWKHSQAFGDNLPLSSEDIIEDGIFFRMNLDRQSFLDNNDNDDNNANEETQHTYNLRPRREHQENLLEEYNDLDDEDDENMDTDNMGRTTSMEAEENARSNVGEQNDEPGIDYFEEIQSDGSTLNHAIQIGAIKAGAISTARKMIEQGDEELNEDLCGINHPRVNSVHYRHLEVFRNLNNILLRTILQSIDSTISTDDTSSTSTTSMDETPTPLNEEELCKSASVAQFLLPTIYFMLQRSKRSRGTQSQKSYLKELEQLPTQEMIGCIIHLYKIGRSKLQREERPYRSPSVNTIQKKVRQLVVEEGHVSRGMNYLCRHAANEEVEAPPCLTQEEFRDKVQSLHPRRDVLHDNFTLFAEDEENNSVETNSLQGITPSATMMNSTIRRLKRDSTPGWDGWTFQLIRQLYEEEEVDDENVSDNGALLIQFVQCGLQGKLPLQKLWNVSKIILIPEWKAERKEWKHRPIAIGTSWYRLLGKTALNILGDSVGRQLAPYQFAVGIPDGISIAATILQHFQEDDNHAILSIDLSNAFNSLRRCKIYDGLKQYAPQLLPFFQWSYAEETELRSLNGILMGHAGTGTRQGDPLSMLYFAVGIHPLIEKLSVKITQLNPENFLQSYADDISLCIKEEDLPQAWNTIAEVFPIGSNVDDINEDREEEFHKIGIAVNPGKCFAITTPGSCRNLVNSQMHRLRTVHSAKIFGIMVGEIEARQQFSRDLYSSIEKKASFIRDFCGVKAGFTLVKYCLNSIATYVHRIETEDTLDLPHHDSIISETIANLLDKNKLSPVADCLRGLPHKLSGLGILHHAGPQTRINHDALRQRTRSWLENCGLASAEEPNNAPDDLNEDSSSSHRLTHVGLQKVLDTFPGLEEDENKLQKDLGFENGTRDNTSTHIRKFKLHKQRWNNLMTQLKQDSATVGDALWIDASAFNGSGNVLLCGSHHARWFNDEDFKSLLETKLLLNPIFDQNQGKHLQTICRGCNLTQHQHPMTARKFHYLNCRINSRLRIQRHNFIKGHLKKLLSKVLPADQDMEINISEEQHISLHEHDQRRSDITITWADATKTHFDVGITSPILNMLVSRMTNRNGPTNSLEAATQMHEEKLRKYKDTRAELFPIIFLATGRPSQQLRHICTALQQRSHLNEKLFMKCWRDFLRTSTRTCLQFTARTNIDRPQVEPLIKSNSANRQRSYRKTQRRLQQVLNNNYPRATNTRITTTSTEETPDSNTTQDAHLDDNATQETHPDSQTIQDDIQNENHTSATPCTNNEQLPPPTITANNFSNLGGAQRND